MKSTHPELALERLLLELEHDLIGATDEELLTAARELGMNPSMKRSSAFFGVTLPASWLRETGEQENAPRGPRTKGDRKPIEATREQLYSWLTALTPQDAKAVRARFGIDAMGRASDEEEVILRALARDLAVLQKRQ